MKELVKIGFDEPLGHRTTELLVDSQIVGVRATSLDR